MSLSVLCMERYFMGNVYSENSILRVNDCGVCVLENVRFNFISGIYGRFVWWKLRLLILRPEINNICCVLRNFGWFGSPFRF